MRSSLLLMLFLIIFGENKVVADPSGTSSELVVEQIVVGRTALELSGITALKDRLFIVSDGPDEHYLYRVESSQDRMDLIPALDLATLEGYDDYIKSLALVLEVEPKDRRLDLEGIAACGDDLYLVNERVRHVLLVEGGKKITRLPIDFSAFDGLWQGGANAGFEGIAVDCIGKTLYVAKEREPRALFTIDMTSWTSDAGRDFAASNRAYQRVVNVFSGDGLLEIGPDLSDLSFDNGYLYVLERASYEVTKIDPETMDVMARVSYLQAERPLYETGEPFGIAEALSLTKDQIIIGLDNNGSPLSGTASRRLGVSGPHETLIYFKRPAGF